MVRQVQILCPLFLASGYTHGETCLNFEFSGNSLTLAEHRFPHGVKWRWRFLSWPTQHFIGFKLQQNLVDYRWNSSTIFESNPEVHVMRLFVILLRSGFEQCRLSDWCSPCSRRVKPTTSRASAMRLCLAHWEKGVALWKESSWVKQGISSHQKQGPVKCADTLHCILWWKHMVFASSRTLE